MTEGNEGHQPSEEEFEDAEAHLTFNESHMSKMREKTRAIEEMGEEEYKKNLQLAVKEIIRLSKEYEEDIYREIDLVAKGDPIRRARLIEDQKRFYSLVSEIEEGEGVKDLWVPGEHNHSDSYRFAITVNGKLPIGVPVENCRVIDEQVGFSDEVRKFLDIERDRQRIWDAISDFRRSKDLLEAAGVDANNPQEWLKKSN